MTVDELVRKTRAAQLEFSHDVDEVRLEFDMVAAGLLGSVGEMSRGEALEYLRKATVTAIDRCRARRLE